VIIDTPVTELVEEAFDFFIADGFPQPDVVDVRNRHEYGRVVRDYSEMEESTRGTQNSFFFDAFDDAEPMIRVDDLVTELECHVSPVAE
jgi:hypothetical protein